MITTFQVVKSSCTTSTSFFKLVLTYIGDLRHVSKTYERIYFDDGRYSSEVGWLWFRGRARHREPIRHIDQPSTWCVNGIEYHRGGKRNRYDIDGISQPVHIRTCGLISFKPKRLPVDGVKQPVFYCSELGPCYLDDIGNYVPVATLG